MIGQIYLRLETGQLYGLMTIAKIIDSGEKYAQLLSMEGEILLIPYADFFSEQYQPAITLNDLSGLVSGMQNIQGNVAFVQNFNNNHEQD